MADLALRDAENTALVNTAIAYHLEAGGQRFRAKLALSVSWSLGLQAQDSVCLASACELLHNASLIHDDLQDGDTLRRGRETVWSLFGKNVAICAGDLLISAAYAALAELTVPTRIAGLVRLLHRGVGVAIHGQAADLSFGNGEPSSFADYERIAAAKSGSLLSLPLELPLAYAGHSAFLAPARSAARAFAIGYQIADDLEDTVLDSGAKGRPATMNAVAVLRAAGHDRAPEKTARRRARELFEFAAEKSQALPYDCGREMAASAAQFAGKL